ncbi:type VI secretion protein [Streptomyces sp. TRM 70351]|uniref:type VI secretion protein n=1 Tax=Streptomyces sp. TRM 70351 TaxID=3116552 RepID=UPI002E7B7EA8|nr:type VI secretion protein [Streptomyces sp. TRM 70351]MEE1931359.1 type VI secretion protein [Streptomyces sp. TRM 70351]
MAGHTAPPPAVPPRRASGGVPDGLLLGLLGLLLGLTLLAWTAAGLAGLLSHGRWPDGVALARTPTALRSLVTAPADLAAAWPDAEPGALPGPGLFWGLLIGQVMVLFVLALAAMTSLTRRRARRTARRLAVAANGPHAAGAAAPRTPAPADPPDQSAGRTRPAGPAQEQVPAEPPGGPAAHDAPPAASAAAPVAAGRHPVPAASHAPAELPVPGHVSGLHLRHTADPAATLAAVAGPAVVVTADPALWAGTVGARAKLGPAHVYDPGHVTDAPVRLRWAPERGCADPGTARSRAAALLAPVRSPAVVDQAVHEAAETLLRCCLHAAAVSGRSFRDAHRWAAGGAATEAVRILRKHRDAASGAAGELEATLVAHSERRDQAHALIRHALASLSQLHVRNACAAARNDSVALESFAAEMGTVYIVGAPMENPRRDAGTLPLLTALTSSVVEHGRRMAERSSSGRLDPPMTLILDGPATLAPLPELPSLLASGEEWGLHTHAYLRSTEQARTWWPGLTATQLGRTTPSA